MDRRRRIAVLEPVEEGISASLASSNCDVVPIQSAADGIERFSRGEFDGLVLAPTDGYESGPRPSAAFSDADCRRLVDQLCYGIAIVGEDFRLSWYNDAFSQLCGGAARIGANVFEAVGRPLEVVTADGLLAACRGKTAVAMVHLSVPSGRHFELRFQPLLSHQPRRDIACLVRDRTSDVNQHEKMLAIHRAGVELSHLTPSELAEMSTSDRLELLKANILQYSLKTLNYKNFEIRLLDPATQALRVLISEGMEKSATAKELYARSEGNGVTGYVACTGKSYLLGDVTKDPLYIPGAPDARSSLTVPMRYRDAVIGTFNVESPDSNRFTESDREFLEVFAREIAVGLHTLDLLKEEKRHGGTASVEAILTEVGVPIDDILNDSIRVLGALDETLQKGNPAHEAIRRVLVNARTIKRSIQTIRRGLQPPKDKTDGQASSLGSRRALLADEDPEIRRSAHRLLGQIGCEVDTAKDGAEAVALARAGQYDIVLGDIRLPDMDGYTFFRKIRETCPDAPIVLMTGFGYDPTHSLVKARAEEPINVLYKPFRLDRLRESVEEALKKGKPAQQGAAAASLRGS